MGGQTSVIDLDRETEGVVGEMGGGLYICLSCGEDLAALIGCASPTQTARYQGQIRNLKGEIAQLETELRAIEGRVVDAVHG